MLELSGVPAADAATGAKDVLAFETRLAKASKSAEELSRDVSLYYNPTTIADADKLTPAFSWTKFFEAQGVTVPKLDGFTREQRFFYGWATVWRRNHTKDELEVRLATDPHAPAKFRAIGTPSNLAVFAEAFACKPGDPMVRDKAKQIAIW